jgi:hypothetical protein
MGAVEYRAMRSPLTLSAALLLVVVPGRLAEAQEKGQVGLTMGYPASVGVVWHLTDAIAVRPELTFATTSDGFTTNQSSSTSVGTGVSGLFYLGRWESVRAYVSPRYIYQRSTSTVEVDVTPLLPPALPVGIVLPSLTTKTTITNQSVIGAFGAQYSPHRRFSVFGEVGFGYSRLETSTGTPITGISTEPSATSHSWSTRSGAGIIFYF